MSDKNKPIKLNCPTCEKQITWDAKNLYRPFCSKRCRLIDLGAWANEEHKIAGQSLDPYEDLLSEDQSLQQTPKVH